MDASPVARCIRDEMRAIASHWEKAVLARLPPLASLERAALYDHLPEFLLGLAAWVDGDEETGRRGFRALVEGHALQRLGHGIDLETLCAEYAVLRAVILRELLAVEGSDENRRALIRVNEGIDFGIAEAIQRYSTQRDLVRDRFVAILGHDLRTPLSAIMLATANIAARPCAEAKHAETALVIERSAGRMHRMISDVLDFTRAHLGGGIPSTPIACHLGEIAREATAELRSAHPRRELRVETRGELDGYWDRDRVSQAMVNLIGNAIEHGRDPILVEVEEQPDHLAVVTRISNTGSDMPPAALARLFEPFAHDPGRRTGLGLGLYIVQQIALSHGAVCSVRSEHGTTTFSIVWPRVPISRLPDRA